MNLFVSPDDEIKVSIVVGDSKTKKDLIYANVDEASLREVAGDDLSEFKEYEVTFRYPTYLDATRIADAATQLSQERFYVAPSELRLGRLVQLIKSWTLDATVPDRAAIEKLNPLVASCLGASLDDALKERGLL